MPVFRTVAPPDFMGAIHSTISRLNKQADEQSEANDKHVPRLVSSLRRALTGGRPSALDEMQVDAMAAQTAQRSALAHKVAAEADELHASNAARANPEVRAKYAGHSAGIDEPDALRMDRHLRAVPELPSTADYQDADIVGRTAQPFRTAAPVLEPSQRDQFQSAMASTYGSDLATGRTNADQLAHAGDRITRSRLAARAAEERDLQAANRLIAAGTGRIREPFRLGTQGQVLNEETGAVDEAPVIAQAARELLEARTDTESARQDELGSRATVREARPGPAVRETALERNLKHLVAVGAAPDERSALALLRRGDKSEQDKILGLAKVLMTKSAYIGKDGNSRAIADATAMVRSAGKQTPAPRASQADVRRSEPASPAPATFGTAEDVRAAFKAGKIDRAGALLALQQFGFDPE